MTPAEAFSKWWKERYPVANTLYGDTDTLKMECAEAWLAVLRDRRVRRSDKRIAVGGMKDNLVLFDERSGEFFELVVPDAVL